MGKLRNYIRRIRHMSFQNLFYVTGKIHREQKRPYFVILFDILWCSIKYGAGYMDYHEFEFYLLNGKERKTYITVGMNQQLVKKYNDSKKKEIFCDKTKFNTRFQEYIGRDWLNLEKSSYKKFASFCAKKERIIAKPAMNYAGVDVEIIELKNKNLKELYNRLLKNDQIVVEEVLVNHKKLQQMYPKALNTLRVITFVDGNEVHILKTILKLGNGGTIDNFAQGGMYTFYDEFGTVTLPAIDKNGKAYQVHPVSKKKIVGFQIPMYEEVIKLVQKAALEEPSVHYVGWDVAVTDHGPVLIEGNESSGVFQVKPSLSKDKCGEWPNYSRYMSLGKRNFHF